MADTLKSSSVSSVHGMVVLNPDGSSIGSGGGGGGGGTSVIVDGVDALIKATVKDLTNSNPLATQIVDANGDAITSFGGGTQYTEDAAAAANPVGTAVNLVRQDTPAGLVSADGDNVAQRGTNYGAAYTQIVSSTGSFIDSFGGGTQYTEDAAAAANPVGTSLTLVRDDAHAGGIVSADGDNISARGSNAGALYVTPINEGYTAVDADLQPARVVQVGGEAAGALNAWHVDSNGLGSITGNVGITDGTDVADVLDLASSNPLAVAIVDGSGIQITSFGGGTQYTEDAAAAADPVGTMGMMIRKDTPSTTVSADGDNIAFRGTNYGAQYVTALSTGGTAIDFATSAKQDTGNTSLASLAGQIGTDLGSAGGTFLFIGGQSSGDAYAIRANGEGAILIGGTTALGGDMYGLNINSSGWASTLVQEVIPGVGTADLGKAEDAASTDGATGVGVLAVRKATPANTSGTDGDYEFLQMSAGRLWASATIDAALPAGTNAIGKLAANSGVDIGDVDVTSSIPGTGATNLGKAEDAQHTTGDTGVFILGIRNDDAATTIAGTTADYSGLSTDLKGRLITIQKSATSTLSNVNASASSVTVLAANTDRSGASVYNDSSSVCYLKCGTTASSTSFSVKLLPDSYFEVPSGHTGILTGIWVTATGVARVTEYTS